MSITQERLSTMNHEPKLAIIGGRLEDNNADIYQMMHQLSKGKILVFPTASAEPEVVGPETVEIFRQWGFEVTLVPLSVENCATVAYDPHILQLLEEYGSVFFTGGNQIFIADALAPQGKATPLLEKLRSLHQQGGLIAGSSAGAAMMSSLMIVGGTSLEATSFGLVTDPDQAGLLLDQGLDFFKQGIVDQHFIKRGRFGRLLIALLNSKTRYGFGIDENTALFVMGDHAWVTGEYGVFIIDTDGIRIDDHQNIRNIQFSYLDDGDSIDLDTGMVHVAQDKVEVAEKDIVYRAPSCSVRNVFGAYTLYDLLSRLVLGDPAFYCFDSARAVEPIHQMMTIVELQRQVSSQSLIAVRNNATRITALGFTASLKKEQMVDQKNIDTWQGATLSRNYGLSVGREARMILLGANPVRSSASSLMRTMAEICQGSVGIIACASASPRSDAYEYIRALESYGVNAEYFDITIDNIDQVNRDQEVLDRLQRMQTILITGGNQIRLIEALLMRSEVTPVLQVITAAWAVGKPIIAIGGAASAMSGFMVAGGSSWEALKYGIASDLGRRGLVLQEGLGLFGTAIIDQNLASSRRLGRLVVACAEEGVKYGLGICEDSGLIATNDNKTLEVIGDKGVVLIETNPRLVRSSSDEFISPEMKIHYAQPGDVIDLEKGMIHRKQTINLANNLLCELIIDLIYECRNDERNETWGETYLRGSITIEFTAHEDGSGTLTLASTMDRRG